MRWFQASGTIGGTADLCGRPAVVGYAAVKAAAEDERRIAYGDDVELARAGQVLARDRLGGLPIELGALPAPGNGTRTLRPDSHPAAGFAPCSRPVIPLELNDRAIGFWQTCFRAGDRRPAHGEGPSLYWATVHPN